MTCDHRTLLADIAVKCSGCSAASGKVWLEGQYLIPRERPSKTLYLFMHPSSNRRTQKGRGTPRSSAARPYCRSRTWRTTRCLRRTIRRSVRRSRPRKRNMSGSKARHIIIKTSLPSYSNASTQYWTGAAAKDCSPTDRPKEFSRVRSARLSKTCIFCRIAPSSDAGIPGLGSRPDSASRRERASSHRPSLLARTLECPTKEIRSADPQRFQTFPASLETAPTTQPFATANGGSSLSEVKRH